MKRFEGYHNYELHPIHQIAGCENEVYSGFGVIGQEIEAKNSRVVVVEVYPGVDQAALIVWLRTLRPELLIEAEEYAKPAESVDALFAPFLTEDRVFGIMNRLQIRDCYDEESLARARQKIQNCKGRVIIVGTGASLITHGDLLIYADMTRWEIQLRYRNGMSNWHTENGDAPQLTKYKRGFFIEWRMADRFKNELFGSVDFWLDTSVPAQPVLLSARGMKEALSQLSSRPLRLQPYFDPGVWGGHWMKDNFELPENGSNYAWCFDGVPEENSFNLCFGDTVFAMPAMNLVLRHPKQLLGERVFARFGAEYPIRFDFLDTMGGENLSLQVHPTTDYIRKTFGMPYTQDESYYILATDGDEPCVYLGLKDNVDPQAMEQALRTAQAGGAPFDAERYVNCFPVNQHDHVLIPAGTVHCSGKNTMVLEISSTPYIFTFKLWDWGRLGLDGLPRPIHIDHGMQNICWERTTQWVEKELLHREIILEDEPGVKRERIGLHELEFIEVQRYSISKPVTISCNGSVHQLNLVEGAALLVTSETGAFSPFEVHYAETFMIPAAVSSFTLQPHNDAQSVMVLDASVR